MEKEILTLKRNGTWSLVPRPENKKVLSNKWVFKTKTNSKGEVEKYKARLVARGHIQKAGIDYEEIFAPVARYEIIRTLLAVAVEEEMHVHQMDVVSAYVQGNLHDEVFMEQPEMFIEEDNKKVCKLHKPLYGLKQSGREWYKRLDEFIIQQGGCRNEADPCLYVFGKNEKRVIMIIYVDDIILVSKELREMNIVKCKLKSEFEITDLGQITDILGIHVEREGEIGSIKLSQEKYIDELLKKFNMNSAKTVSTPIGLNIKITKDLEPKNDEEREQMKNRPYRELVGGLIYLANATRPDIVYAANTLSRFCSDPGEEHWHLAKRVLQYIKGTKSYGIKYMRNKQKLVAYTDSDWAGDVEDRRSQSGSVLTLAGGAVTWKSKKQPTVSLSTMEAEYIALSEVSKEIIYLKRLLIHMQFNRFVESPVCVFCDNQSAIELAKNAVYHKRSKHIDIKFHFTRELVEKKEIKIVYLRTDFMLADIFTKALSKIKHDRAIEMLNLRV